MQALCWPWKNSCILNNLTFIMKLSNENSQYSFVLFSCYFHAASSFSMMYHMYTQLQIKTTFKNIFMNCTLNKCMTYLWPDKLYVWWLKTFSPLTWCWSLTFYHQRNFSHQNANYFRSGFLKLYIRIDILEQVIICCGELSCAL